MAVFDVFAGPWWCHVMCDPGGTGVEGVLLAVSWLVAFLHSKCHFESRG